MGKSTLPKRWLACCSTRPLVSLAPPPSKTAIRPEPRYKRRGRRVPSNELLGFLLKRVLVLICASPIRCFGGRSDREGSAPGQSPRHQMQHRGAVSRCHCEEQTVRGWLSFPGSRCQDARLKYQGAILHEFLPLCDDVALQRGATFVIHLRHRASERSAMDILPKKLFRWREA